MACNCSLKSIKTNVFKNQEEGSKDTAKKIAAIIRKKASEGKIAVLGLATGSSPIKVYQELVRMHKEDGLSFQNVVTFNLDEYYGLDKSNPQSYWYFMHHHLFNHIDIKPENINIPLGTIPENEVGDFCILYEKKIQELGGLDFQLLGIGRTGHIGFNEPPSSENSITRLIHLHQITINDAAKDFSGAENVPKSAITMGVSTILKAKEVYLLAWGENKAEIVERTINGVVSADVPASFLKKHSNCTFVLDEKAAANLKK